LPLPLLNLSEAISKRKHDALVGLVNQMLDCEKELVSAVTESDVARLARRRQALDDRIERAVDELYGLSPTDKKVVEAALS
jgi:hypothetical protein